MMIPYVRLEEGRKELPFDCGDQDLNEFLSCDAILYSRQLLAVTYCLDRKDETILYFALSNDKLAAIEVEKSFWRKIKKSFPHEKHRKDYPAVKIGRFAVNSKYQNTAEHWGTEALNFIKQWMVSDNKTGCRFITVDAYKQAVPFYQKNNFFFMGSEEEKRYNQELNNPDSESTFSMYYDLLRLKE